MDPIINDFDSDLNKICHQLDFIDAVKKFSGGMYSGSEEVAESEFESAALAILEEAKKNHTNFPVVCGTLVLYTCGRFEAMIKTLLEDLCQRLATKAVRYANLPKKMRENLIVFTAKVIAEPRKYGHGDGAVRSFVATLAANLEAGALLSDINYQCLSITDSNLKADVLDNLFSRVGADKIWKNISEQASMKTFFQESDASKVETQARKKLDGLMDVRNKIAHPSGEIEWPSTDNIRENIGFLRVIAKAIGDQMGVYEVTLCKQIDASV